MKVTDIPALQRAMVFMDQAEAHDPATVESVSVTFHYAQPGDRRRPGRGAKSFSVRMDADSPDFATVVAAATGVVTAKSQAAQAVVSEMAVTREAMEVKA